MSESNALCPSCKEENLKAFADVPLEDPVLGEKCSEKYSSDCVNYEGLAYVELGIASGMSLTDLIGILAQNAGATPLTTVSTEDSDHITHTGDGTVSSPLTAAIGITVELADKILDQFSLNPVIRTLLDVIINDTLGSAPAPVGCVVTGTHFANIFNHPSVYSASGTWYGVQDSDGTARYELAYADQLSANPNTYTSMGISQIVNGEIKRFTQRSTSTKWKYRKYCGLDGSGSQVFSNWVQGPDITPF